MTRRHTDTHFDAHFDDACLEYLASSLLCDDAPPPSVHDHWKEHHAADGDGESAAVIRFPGRGARSQFAPAAAAAAAVVILAGGAWLTLPGGPRDAGGDVGDGTSSSTVAQPGPAQPDIDLAALGPAAGEAMGERDLGGLRDPALAAACLAQHGENEDALLGAAPMAHGGGVGQLFVLSAGMHGRVTVLLTENTCGTDPAPPVVHRTIGAHG